MGNDIEKASDGHVSPFERIKRTNRAGNEYWESRDLAEVLDYTQYRNFEAVIEKARLACFNSGHRIEDHFADVSKMVGEAPKSFKVASAEGALLYQPGPSAQVANPQETEG